MAEPRLRLGTRGSALALAQAEQVAKLLGGAEVVPIKSSGDSERAPTPDGDKARFVREIERALLDGEVDIGVHSAKDLPSELPDGLEIAGVRTRAMPMSARWIRPAARRRAPGSAPRRCGAELSFSHDGPTLRSPSSAAT